MKMEKELLSIGKYWLVTILELYLFGVAAWDTFDHVTRTVSGLGAIIILIFLVRKYRQDYEIKNLEKDKLKLEIEREQREFDEKYNKPNHNEK